MRVVPNCLCLFCFPSPFLKPPSGHQSLPPPSYSSSFFFSLGIKAKEEGRLGAHKLLVFSFLVRRLGASLYWVLVRLLGWLGAAAWQDRIEAPGMASLRLFFPSCLSTDAHSLSVCVLCLMSRGSGACDKHRD